MSDNVISKYDRLRGSMHQVAMFTRPSTIKNVYSLLVVSQCYLSLGLVKSDTGRPLWLASRLAGVFSGKVLIPVSPKV